MENNVKTLLILKEINHPNEIRVLNVSCLRFPIKSRLKYIKKKKIYLNVESLLYVQYSP